MEFKFRAVDDRPPTYLSPSSSIGFFTEQTLRDFTHFPAGYMDPSQNPNDVREAIQREIEKERIRDEILTAEIARRRVLEAEVRRELMLEREMAMRRGTEMGFSFEERLAMRFDPRFSFTNQFESRIGYVGRATPLDVLPPLPRLPDAIGSEINAPSEVNDKKDKLIILAKPNPNMSGAKRKDVTPPASGAGELPVFGIKKKPKEEWSCALCQVSATSKRGLDEHLQGRKHKAKEAGLRAQKMKASFGPLPRKTGKPSKPMATNGTSGSKLETKVGEESLQQNKTGDHSDQKTEDAEDLKNKKDEPPVQKKRNSEYWKKKNEVARVERTLEFRNMKRFRFWCEMCQIGAYSEIVMETHKKGKKHRALLQELGQNGEAVPSPTPVASSEEASEEAKELKEVAQEEDEKTENVVADADEPSQSPEAI